MHTVINTKLNTVITSGKGKKMGWVRRAQGFNYICEVLFFKMRSNKWTTC